VRKSSEAYSSNHNFELLLTQIFCRRLNLGRGIVRMRVGFPYDLLRFSPRSYDLSFILYCTNSAGFTNLLNIFFYILIKNINNSIKVPWIK
jgi:hypothetical protein